MSTSAAPQAATSTCNIDPVHSLAEFKVKHTMISDVRANSHPSRELWFSTKPT
jgi:polyisoprenoid-binding protein YceI